MSRITKNLRKVTAFVLVAVTALIYPVQIAAEEYEGFEADTEYTAETAPEEGAEYEDSIPEPEIIAELDENRDAVTKCFELNNGNKMLVQYDYPVHYKDENGEWIEYDNTMTQTTAEDTDSAETEAQLETEDEASSIESDETIAESDNSPAESEISQEETTNEQIADFEDGNPTDSQAEINEEAEISQTEENSSHDESITRESASEIVTEYLQEQPTEVITEEPAEAEAIAGDSENIEYKNKKSDIDIRLSKKAKLNNMIKIKADGYMVSWGYKGANKSGVEFVDNNEELTGNDKFTTPKNVIKEAVYKDIFTDADLQCYVSSAGVKENIILKNKNAQNEFEIQYKIKDLTAEQLNSNTIELKDKDGKTVYSITAPYMTDSKGEHSEKLQLKITEQKKNKLMVKLSADKSWINSEEREFPITIDPSFNTGQEWQAVSCTYLDNAHPNTCYGYGSTTGYTGSIYAGTFGQGMYRTLIKMNSLPALNKGDVVVGAYVNLHLYRNDFYDDMYVSAHHVYSTRVNDADKKNNPWAQDEVTWNTRPDFQAAAIDYERFVENDPDAWHDWDITTSVKRWYNGEANNGIMLKSYDEASETQCASLYSSNYPASATPRAVFTIIYRNNKGLEDYWTYSSFNVGTAGTAYINDYSGSLTFITNDMSTPGGRAPANVEHVFNNYMANEKYSRSTPYVGNGWRLNIQQTVTSSKAYGLTGEAAEKYPYVYTDADGTEHYFYKKTENGKTKYLDEDGLKLELNFSENNDVVTIKDEKNNILEFDRNGLLTKMTDSNGNSATVNYTSGTIKTVRDAAGKMLTFSNTGSSNFLSKITDPAGRARSYSYTNNMLTQIQNPDGTTVKFTYDSDGYC